MPALVNRSVGSLWGTTEDEGTANTSISHTLFHTLHEQSKAFPKLQLSHSTTNNSAQKSLPLHQNYPTTYQSCVPFPQSTPETSFAPPAPSISALPFSRFVRRSIDWSRVCAVEGGVRARVVASSRGCWKSVESVAGDSDFCCNNLADRSSAFGVPSLDQDAQQLWFPTTIARGTLRVLRLFIEGNGVATWLLIVRMGDGARPSDDRQG